MSFQITTAFVEGFRNNIYMLAQQKTARLYGKSRNESQNSEVEFFERIAPTDAVDILDRHGDTPILNSEHSRRAVTLQDAEWGDLIDKMDRVRMLINPDDAYVQTAVAALNRKKDDVFIAAALGDARGGKQGASTISLPNSQKLVATDGATAVNLNVLTLTLVQKKFDEADIEEDMSRYFAYSGSQKQSLLNQEKATSSDYASVKALVMGKINSFMGFEFIRSQRLPVTSAITAYDPATGELGGGSNLAAGARRCFAWIEDGMISSHGEDLIARISERDDKRYSTQIYVAHSVGAVRMEEEKVVEVICNEA
jgi:hypothetical protein